MRANASYIFFRLAEVEDPRLGPPGAAGVPLTPGRSLAVDSTLWRYGTPFWLEGRIAGEDAPGRLVVAADTGSAIVGPARGGPLSRHGRSGGDRRRQPARCGRLRRPAAEAACGPMRMPRRPRGLSGEDAFLWGEIARLITPLRGRAPSPKAKTLPTGDPLPPKRKPEVPALVAKPVAKPVAERAGLPGGVKAPSKRIVKPVPRPRSRGGPGGHRHPTCPAGPGTQGSPRPAAWIAQG